MGKDNSNSPSSAFFFTTWAVWVLCSPDTALWNFIFFIYNVVRLIVLLYKEYHPPNIKPSKLHIPSPHCSGMILCHLTILCVIIAPLVLSICQLHTVCHVSTTIICILYREHSVTKNKFIVQ